MSSKYQREIEDILEKAGVSGSSPARRKSEPAPKRSFPRLVWMYVKQSLSGRPLSFSPGRIMLIGALLLLSFLVVSRFSPGIAGIIAWSGLIVFIIGYGLVLAKPPSIEKRWRGQPIESDHPSWFDRIRRKIRRR